MGRPCHKDPDPSPTSEGFWSLQPHQGGSGPLHHIRGDLDSSPTSRGFRIPPLHQGGSGSLPHIRRVRIHLYVVQGGVQVKAGGDGPVGVSCPAPEQKRCRDRGSRPPDRKVSQERSIHDSGIVGNPGRKVSQERLIKVTVIAGNPDRKVSQERFIHNLGIARNPDI